MASSQADTTLAGLDALDLGGARPSGGARERAARIASSVWPQLAAIVLVWIVWELIHLSGWEKLVLPGPGVTLSNLWAQAQTGLLWHAIGDTLERAVIGYALALVIGTVVGLLVARIPPLRAAVGSLITGLQTMPSAAWIPFAIILFGLNTSAILFIIVMAVAPSIANAMIAGVDYTPPLLPKFVAGMKQGWAFTWHALLTAELLVLVPGKPSIGVLFQADQDQTDMPSTIAIMIVILILGVLVDVLFGRANNAIRKRWGLT